MIDSDEEEPGRSPAQLDIPIITPANEIFDSDNLDSDLDFQGEAEAKNIIGEFYNAGKLPARLHGVLLFPQDYNVHGYSWNEYPDEPCSPHCVIPNRADKGFAKFYLKHSLCQKHHATLVGKGPWLYLSNRISTLHKVYKCPEICQFISLIHQKTRPDHMIRNSLIACQITESQHMYTLIIRADIYLVNNPFEIKSWCHTYKLDDMVQSASKIHFNVQKDYLDKIAQAYLDNQP